MARVTVEDCRKQVKNPFALVILAAIRSRQLFKGAKPTVARAKNKAAVIALREIAEGNVYYEGDIEDILREHLANSTASL